MMNGIPDRPKSIYFSIYIYFVHFRTLPRWGSLYPFWWEARGESRTKRDFFRRMHHLHRWFSWEVTSRIKISWYMKSARARVSINPGEFRQQVGCMMIIQDVADWKVLWDDDEHDVGGTFSLSRTSFLDSWWVIPTSSSRSWLRIGWSQLCDLWSLQKGLSPFPDAKTEDGRAKFCPAAFSL